MGNKNGGDDKLKKGIENKNIIVKNLVNYYPKICLTYIGSKNHTFFFADKYKCTDVGCVNKPIKLIVIQQQFSLNGQSKILKKWHVEFWKIAFMNKSHEFIALYYGDIEKWEIDNCYNLTKIFKTKLWNFAVITLDFPLLFLNTGYFHMQLGFEQQQIFFSQQEIEGWNLIEKRYFDLMKFFVNQLGNILIFFQGKKIGSDSNLRFYLKIYIKNIFGKWRIAKQIEVFKDNSSYCFLDNEQIAITIKNIITIWQIKPSKLEVIEQQKLKLDQKSEMQLYGMYYMKQNQLLIVQTKFAIYFIKKNKEIFYFTQYIEIQKELLFAGSEGFLFNFKNIFENQARPWRNEILKIHEN